MAHYSDDLLLAQQLADAADQITQKRFQALDLHIEAKPDHTAVTDADRGVESRLRELIAQHRPDDAIHGEEFADTGQASRQWVLDPIDGTANYVRGVPIWASLIALMDDGVVRTSVVSAPLLGRRWWAVEGQGAWMRDLTGTTSRLRVSAIHTISDAFCSYSSLTGWRPIGRQDQFLALLADCARTRAFGDFFSYMLVAEGVIDFTCEPELELYDKAALDIIVREAGGRFSDIDGHDGSFGPGAIASNAHLHEALVARLCPTGWGVTGN